VVDRRLRDDGHDNGGLDGTFRGGLLQLGQPAIEHRQLSIPTGGRQMDMAYFRSPPVKASQCYGSGGSGMI
jgi:hypothetical protein